MARADVALAGISSSLPPWGQACGRQASAQPPTNFCLTGFACGGYDGLAIVPTHDEQRALAHGPLSPSMDKRVSARRGAVARAFSFALQLGRTPHDSSGPQVGPLGAKPRDGMGPKSGRPVQLRKNPLGWLNGDAWGFAVEQTSPSCCAGPIPPTPSFSVGRGGFLPISSSMRIPV